MRMIYNAAINLKNGMSDVNEFEKKTAKGARRKGTGARSSMCCEGSVCESVSFLLLC